MNATTNNAPATFALPTLANLAVPVVPAAALLPQQPAKPARKAATKETFPCRCADFVGHDGEATGCDARTKRTFAPGHDARTKGLVLRAALAGSPVTDTRTGRVYDDATEVAGLFGFRELVLASLAKAAQREAERLGLVPAATPAASETPAQDDAQQDDAGDLASQVAAEEAAYAAEKAAADAAAEAEFAAAAPAPARRTRNKK